MGLRNILHLQIATILERASQAWQHKGVWAAWVCRRYIITSTLLEINLRYNDNSLWKGTLRNSEAIVACMVCGQDGRFN